MKYAILETDHQMESKSISEFVDTHDDFLSYVVSKSSDVNIVESIDILDLDNSCFKNSMYLLFSIDRQTIRLVEKSLIKDTGYIYSSDKSSLNLLKTFEIIEVDMEAQLIDDQKSNRLTVNKFNLKDMTSNPSILIIGKRGTGKTYIASNILDVLSSKSNKFISNTLIISPLNAQLYRERYPGASIIENYDLNLVITYSRNSKGEGAIIFDNCLSDHKESEEFADLMYSHYQYKKTVIVTISYPLSISPKMRSNFDYVFLLRDDVLTTQKQMYIHYAGMFPDFDSFRQVYDELTLNYSSMVINNNFASLDNNIGYFKAS